MYSILPRRVLAVRSQRSRPCYVELARRSSSHASRLGVHLRRVRGVRQHGQCVARELPADGRCPTTQHAGHGPHAGTPLTHARHRHPIPGLELLVLLWFIHAHTLCDEVLHFIFEAA